MIIMERMPKFRAWDIDNKQFVYAHIGQDDVWIDDGISVVVMPLHHSEWEQYTGLKDKNGKEIYEGDIVEYSWDFCGTKRKNNYVVEWLSGKVEHYPYSVDSGFTLPDSVDGYMVIGNIHENPELLEQGNAKD